MINWSLAIAAGLINWFSTDLLVTGEIFRPFREWVINHTSKPMVVIATLPSGKVHRGSMEHINDLLLIVRPDADPDNDPTKWGFTTEPGGPKPYVGKIGYLVSCQMCTGTWVGIAEALILGLAFSSGFVGIMASALLFKAVGHLVLEAVALGRKLRGE